MNSQAHRSKIAKQQEVAVKALSNWYLRHARPLPWRETHDPYRIWISEVMLQQTQVTTVIPYYQRFLENFPTITALATSPIEAVLAQWSGLGYYSRARNLHRGAQFLLQHHSGDFPRTREEILKVPGIGPYTAGAILSIAFDLPVPLVDGNVQRVFARYFGERREIQLPSVQKLFWEKAALWVSEASSPRVLNQALMELGATVCKKGQPSCEQCPLERTCLSAEKGWQNQLPKKKAKQKPIELFWLALIVEFKGKLFLKKYQEGEWWEDLWGFPHRPVPKADVWDEEFEKWKKQLPGAKNFRPLSIQKHTVTHHKIQVAPYYVTLSRINSFGEPGEWLPIETIPKLPLSSLARKTLASLTSP